MNDTTKTPTAPAITPMRHLGIRRSHTKRTPIVVGDNAAASSAHATASASALLTNQQVDSSPCTPKPPARSIEQHGARNAPLTVQQNKTASSTSATPASTIKTRSTGARLTSIDKPSRFHDKKYIRKRLQFASSSIPSETHDDHDTTTSKLTSKPESAVLETLDAADYTVDQLHSLVAAESAQLAAAESQIAKAADLRSAIAQWEAGFRRAFAELQQLTGTTTSASAGNNTDALLAMLNIPPDLIPLE